jgi:hypothetical protein
MDTIQTNLIFSRGDRDDAIVSKRDDMNVHIAPNETLCLPLAVEQSTVVPCWKII